MEPPLIREMWISRFLSQHSVGIWSYLSISAATWTEVIHAPAHHFRVFGGDAIRISELKRTAGACDMSAINLNSLLRPPFGWWIKRGSGTIFDWLHQVDTGSGAAQNLEIASANRDKGIAYDSCPWSTLAQALRLISVPLAGFTFVDIGCGKGKVLLSAMAMPFQRVVGVEFSSYLSRVAEQNLASGRLFRRKCLSVEVVCADAVQYPIPKEPAVLFFANPFRYEVMEVVLGNIVRSYLEFPRTIFMIFYAASSIMPQINDFLPRETAGRARLRASSVLGQRSVNIFELPHY